MLAGSGSNKPDVLLLGPQVSYMKAEVTKKQMLQAFLVM